MLRILSLDGGPGPLLEIRVLERLEAELERDGCGSLIERADIFAGTSDGGLMALYIAAQLTAVAKGQQKKSVGEILEGCRRFSDDYAAAMTAGTHHLAALLEPVAAVREIAVELASSPALRQGLVRGRLATIAQLPRNAFGAIGELWRVRETLLGRAPISGSEGLREIFTREFGDLTLGDLTPRVVVLSFDTSAWKPRAYRNFGADDDEGRRDKERDLSQRIVDVAMSTAAMPLFLPIYGGASGRGYLDGIFSANNPCTTAVTLALRHLLPKACSDPLSQVMVLSMGATQTIEESNIEHAGGLGAIVDMLAVDDRATRMLHSAPRGERLRYLRDEEVRREVYTRPRRKGVGERSWGWLDYLRRPTFFINMLIHGMNGEASAQSTRLLKGNFFRHAPRVNLARALYRAMFLGRPVDETDLPWNARRCFRDSFDDPNAKPSGDEIRNANNTDALKRWLKRRWFDGHHSVDAVPDELLQPEVDPID